MASSEAWIAENGISVVVSKDSVSNGGGIRSTLLPSSSSRCRKSDSGDRLGCLRGFFKDLREVLLGTKLCALFVAIPFAIFAQYRGFGSPWVFAFSLLGLAPLAERLSFLTEKIALYTGPTVGGLLNATCGNVTELIIAILALVKNNVELVKYSLLGSILSNLLLVLGSSLFCGGIANLSKEQKFNRKQADANSMLLLLGLICNVLPLMCKLAAKSPESTAAMALQLSRVNSVILLMAYAAYLIFQLRTHKQSFEPQKNGEDQDEDESLSGDESPVIGFWSAFIWLVLMTAVVALLSEYLVATIEAVSDSWGLSVSFISVVLLPISGNATEHAAAIIFAFKNKLDITLGVALGSATQISMLVMPLTVLISWMIGVRMGMDLSILETSVLGLSIVLTTFTLQDGTSHYLKGVVLMLCYIAIGTCFFFFTPPQHSNDLHLEA
ncbi:vacuolar cation/proton exchanger 3-like isoform X2 [Andrographis paniculata]|uniref:vacuolar cation/proton exchanger 3-like isoform X2 n=1 Tax=Andrographis paniculata TaxID=175694 RepID=UPI0021E8D8A3|nr:vacuolar cation/proton exchanger 3-like isoform X2 [Andrographis paniculata]